ncbi:MAG: GMC family oxidoreductase [Pseudomonadota bacterium]
MIQGASEIPSGSVLQADVCVIGAGPAGISLTLDLASRGLTVVLLESGGMQESPATQALYEGEVADALMHSPPDKYRHRRFGGSSAIWGGRCMPFDPIDFESRPHVAHSGWPMSYEDLLPFYPQANALAEAGRFSYDAADALPGIGPLFEGFHSERVRTDGLERFSCPTHFGTRYARRLQLAPGVQVLLGANCTGLRLQADGQAVRHVDVASLQGHRFQVAARSTVVATGGLETARLLLASRDVKPQGIGNEHDVVGRYYMCHIAGNVGSLVVKGPVEAVRHGYEISPEGIYCRRRISVLESEQRRLGLANAVARLHFSRITDPAHRNGVLSGLFLARRLISYEYAKRLNDGQADAAVYARHLMNVMADPLDTTQFLTHWLRKRTLAQRKFPSVILRNKTNRFSLEMHGEQVPQSASRVTLTDKQDSMGMPQLRVDWRYCAEDVDSVRRTLDVLAEEFAASGTAQLTYQRETLEEDLMRFGAYGGHHIGTARMGSDPRSSVVDAQCRVHSVNNLYVAGSAVFPTSSQANPTLTLIALALRLGEHLGGRFGHARRRETPTGEVEASDTDTRTAAVHSDDSANEGAPKRAAAMTHD